jgi:DNA repair exonuclease SbcCD ATPase subunit
MKIVSLQAENIKRLRAVRIEPDGNVVVVSGANAQGKSSVLDSIFLALGGRQALQAIEEPVRQGQAEAVATVDLGDFTVTRTWKNGKTEVKVLSPNGGKYPSPQTFLDGLLGSLTFDPLAFVGMKPKEQLDTLLGLVKLDIDPLDIDRQKAGLFDTRTEIGRARDQYKGQLAGLEMVVPSAPAEVSASALVEEYQEAQAMHNAYGAAFAASRDADALIGIARERVVIAQANLEAAQAALLVAEENVTRHTEDAASRRVQLDELETHLPDLDEIKGRLDGLEESNRVIRDELQAAARWHDVNVAHEEHAARYAALTDQIKALEQTKANALAAAKFPIEGLSFDEHGVTYQGVPFSQASSAEQLRVSVAMSAAMSPDIRIGLIRDGSLLDTTNLALIGEIADEQDFQLWIERVDGTVGFVIEDGALA